MRRERQAGCVPIEASGDLFGEGPDGEVLETFQLLDPSDLNTARTALIAAGERLRRVDGLGVEHPASDEGWDERDGPAGHCCVYVADPEPAANGWTVYLDCRAMIPTAMADTMTAILVEELTRHGVLDGRLAPYLPADNQDLGPAEAPEWVRWLMQDSPVRPPGLHPAITFPTGATIAACRGHLTWSESPLSKHEGSWAAEATLGVPDAAAALQHFSNLFARPPFRRAKTKQLRHPGGHVVRYEAASVEGASVEVAALETKHSPRNLKKFGGVVHVTCYQRPPRIRGIDWLRRRQA